MEIQSTGGSHQSEDPYYKKYHKNKIILFIILFCLCVLAAGILLLSQIYSDKKFTEKLMMADQYHADFNYEAAILAYKLVIDEWPDKEETYEKLSELYIMQGKMEDARNILLFGYQNTESRQLLQLMYRIYLPEQTSEETEYVVSDNITSIQGDIEVDDDLFGVVASYNYSQYSGKYSTPEEIIVDEGVLNIKFKGFPGVCVYFNTSDDQYRVDNSRNLPYANKKPNYVVFSGLDELFHNFGGYLDYGTIQNIFGENVSFGYNQERGQYELQAAYQGCVLYAVCDEEGNLTGTDQWNQLVPDSAFNEENLSEETGKISGFIVNALDGQGINAELIFRKGTNRYGTAVLQDKSSANGSYAVTLPEGRYVLEVSAEGFIKEYFDIKIQKGEDKKAMNYTLSPILQTGEIRIVLEWGSYPADLDSYLVGNQADGTSVFVNFINLKEQTNQGIIAELDLDDRNGFGPETTTIYDSNGTYKFSVHDFTNQQVYGSTALSQSGAAVKVYLPQQSQPLIYYVPDGEGTWWDVFYIENGEIREINKIS